MKKNLLSLIALFAALQFSYAQTNTFPSSGNVGIGTTSPSTNLQVSGLTILSNPTGSSYDENLRLPPSTAGYSSIALGATSGVSGTGAGQWSLIRYPASANNMFSIRHYNTDYFNILTNGNVGIGTTTPADKLDVNGHITLSGGSREIHFRDAGNTLRHSVWITPTNVLGMGPGSESNSMFVNTAGNVSIGTLSVPAGYKLAVNGSVIAASMKAQLKANWPDFVFLKDYKLPTLTEVKTYIDKNRHLPDMPSADEVHANGLDLGEMNRLLLKKVEELTLYLIEKDSQIAEQRSKEEKQEARLAALELALKKLIAEK